MIFLKYKNKYDYVRDSVLNTGSPNGYAASVFNGFPWQTLRQAQ